MCLALSTSWEREYHVFEKYHIKNLKNKGGIESVGNSSHAMQNLNHSSAKETLKIPQTLPIMIYDNQSIQIL